MSRGRQGARGFMIGAMALMLCACEANMTGSNAESSLPIAPTPVPAATVPATAPSPSATALGVDTGLLIGLRVDETDDALTSPGAYRTIWLSNDGLGNQELTFEGAILTPKSRDVPELWMFGTVQQRTETDTIAYVVGRQLPEQARMHTIKDDPNENVVLSERLTYVGEDMVSLQVGASYWAGNGYAYSQSAWVKTFAQVGSSGTRYDGFDTRWEDEAHLRIPEAIGEELAAPFMDEATRDAMQAEAGRSLARPLGDNWIVEREDRLWTPKIVGLFDYPVAFYAAVSLPGPYLTTNQPIEETPNWTAVAITRVDVRDTFLSDERNYLLLQMDDRLLLYAYVNDAPVGEPLWTLALKPRETVVMCKWFDGDRKTEWSARFAEAYDSGEYGLPDHAD